MSEIELEDFVDFYKREYNIGADRRYSNRDLWKLKAYAYCVTQYLGYSVSKAAKALHKHHTTLLHHLKRMDTPDYLNAEKMKFRYMEWKEMNEPPILSKAWFRKKFNFPFRITAYQFAELEIKVHPAYYEDAKELCKEYLPLYINITLINDENIVNGQYFAYGESK